MGENLPAPQTTRISVPSEFKEIHPDLVALTSPGVGAKLRSIALKSFLVPFLIPAITFLFEGNLADACKYSALLLVVLLVAIAFTYALQSKRNDYRYATWILKKTEPSKIDAEFSCIEETLEDKPVYAAVIRINSKEFEPYIITTNGKKKENSSGERYLPYTRSLNVHFDPATGAPIVAEDGYGTRYWLRPASRNS
jgi:hypothetical protein